MGHAQRGGEIALVESGDEGGEVSYAGKNDGFGAGDLFGADGALGFGAEFLQGAFDRRQIAGAVIDDSDFHSRPLVDGRTLRRRLSRETAKRSALAKALKIDSTWWCEERP